MFSMIKTEFQKIKRYHILLVGITGMVCSPLFQFFSQMVMAEEYKNPHYDLAALIDATIWGNATIFMPVLITLIGGYLINREYVDDTLKNVLTVPISFQKFLVGKLVAIGLLAVVFGICSVIIALFIGICAGLPDKNVLIVIKGMVQMTGLSVGICIVAAPVIILCSQKPGSFMGGSIAAFIAGYCCMFFKKGLLRDIYPFSAVLTVIGYDTSDWAGTSENGNILLGMASLGTMLLISALLLWRAKLPETAPKRGTRKKGSIMLRSAQQRHLTLMFLLTVPLLLTGCSKDAILNQYNHVIQSAGDVMLTDKFSLEGKREYGVDHYTGTYTADYKDFSGTEYLFGGTSIERKDISITCDMEIADGTAQVFWLSGSDEPVVLLGAGGSYSDTITLPEGGNYIGVTGEGFTGHIEMRID